MASDRREKTLLTTAKVRITLEVKSRATWGPDCTIAQVQQQAVEEVEGVLRNHFVVNGQRNAVACNQSDRERVTVVESAVDAVVVTEERP
jgi:hypothetical protein